MLTLVIPIAEQAKPRKIEIQRGDNAAIGSHEGHKMISGESGQSQNGVSDRQPVHAAG